MNIKPIQNEYENQIVDLILNIQQKEFNVPITIQDQPDLLNIKNFYYEPGGIFLGAFIDDELVGTIALVKFNNQAGAIRKMFVKQEYRGKQYNIAQQLLEELISYSTKNGLRALYLGTVSILQAALRFYERNHFITIQKDELPYDFPLMSPDNVFCKLDLNSEK
ncbi:GNAT family N-acetyltransferase [Flavobacterium sp. MC2016-06]|jgi:GNAT superfamily N-acetyltransferase|uniref:GNAT family N-acetyltransferase n=1 Tax=Flavobacterium sp. MC2016-06 TaxID=2676308 RepID=UPI0012BA6B71|nr:GNAT family N-acetyltransferase [Flavobacterium sp. MC2016-06]MBU3857506.1 GNAT family N-acetyltransferase [Flavobacterium sp. MC2016-06]